MSVPVIKRRRAFTLIELLVVIAVIALLIGILLPALGKARSQGQSAKCQGHMRQYGTAHQIYVTDYDVMPGLGRETFTGDEQWNVEVGLFSTDENGINIDIDPATAKLMNGFADKYMKDARITTCPADPLTRPGTEPGFDAGRMGNLLTPDEDPKAVGSCMTRVWFNPASAGVGDPPPDYIVKVGRVYATVGGLTESHELTFLRPDRLQLPSQSADAVEEDEDSILNNSLFVAQSNAAPDYPPIPGEYNLIANNHPASSGNIVYHDGHVSNIPQIDIKYWTVSEDDPDGYETRVEIIWWPYYKDNDDQP
jgi:prepilin-type N-terminal cleavage/methylation domain-containing protein/prepilin-type processing-associated H-X9-DG protein